MRVQVRIHAIVPLERLRHERKGLRYSLVRLRATEAQEPSSRVAEALAAQAGDAARFVCAFQ